MERSLRSALARGDLVLCLALMHSRTPDVPAIAAASGFDAVYVDLEHTSTSLETAALLCSAAVGAGIHALVRVPSHDLSVIARVLDNGAVGIIVPHVETADEARKIVQAARFPPLGRRSISGPTIVSGYSPMSATELTATLERETVVAVMVESSKGVAEANAIAATEGVDMILLGPSDLTAEMGIHAQYDHPDFSAAVDAVTSACRDEGTTFGIAGIRSIPLLRQLVAAGLRFISAGTDVGLLGEAATSRALQLRDLDCTSITTIATNS